MFWERFNDLCNQRNSKPNPVAKEIGVSSGIASKWKNLGTLPSGETLQKIADYFDCSVDYLLGRTASPVVGLLGSASAADYSSLEEEHIKKYRQLSQQGKQTVDTLVDNLLLMNGETQEIQKTALENA